MPKESGYDAIRDRDQRDCRARSCCRFNRRAGGAERLRATSTIHTRDSSFRKAYTVVTLGPIFHFDASSTFAELAAKNPAGPAILSLPDILPLAGGVAIKVGDEIVAALGVGGAPGGDKDEACARAGVAKIQDRVTAAVQKRAG